MRSVCVFCGASPGADPAYAAAASAFGALLARTGRRLVYGGGHVGLMGAVADAALAGGGTVVGVIPQSLVEREIAHSSLTELRVVPSMHERKALMAELSDGFVALPGGIGTLEELLEVWTWGQLGLHRKPYGLLNVGRFYDPFLAVLDHLVAQRFVRREHRELVLVDEEAERLVERMARFDPPALPRWIDRVGT
jgi:uncharacterized protein (TIGR00730 family)